MLKNRIDDLAICGGQPAFNVILHVGRPNLGDRRRFLERVDGMLDRCWLTNDGPLVKEFEERISEIAGVRYCVAMCNATVALEIAIRALELKGEVIVPSYTFIATAHALQWQEITPVFADIDSQTYNLDPSKLERLITPRTSGIIGVHTWGRPCDTRAIEAVGRRHGLKVMYDAAHAFGCSHHGQMVGGFGSCEVFSFHATKFINSCEGGAVVTDNEELSEKIRLMRNFGFSGYDRVIYPGTNGKMTEVCAAMGLTSLEGMDGLVALNQRNYLAYAAELEGLPGISLIAYPPLDKNNYQYIVAQVRSHECPLNRDELVRVLHAENVLARKYFWPGCHRMEPYRSLQPNAGLLLPETERVAQEIIVLPTGQAISPETVKAIVSIIRTALYEAKAVRKALSPREFTLDQGSLGM